MVGCCLWFAIALVCDTHTLTQVDPSVLEFLEHHLRLYLPELLCSSVDGDPATAHVFERTVQLSQHDMIGAVSVPLQLTFVLKVANGGKLNSHLWFLIGFCRQLQPKYFLVRRQLMRLVGCRLMLIH